MKNWRKNNYNLGLIKAASFFISVLVALSSFCLPAHAFGDYNKAEHGTLTNTDWNNLINDFLSFNGGWINGNVGILTSSTDTYALNVNGTINATNFIGTLTGTVNAGNISAGDFGSNTGGGNYSFPGNIGIGTTNPTVKLDIQGLSEQLLRIKRTDVFDFVERQVSGVWTDYTSEAGISAGTVSGDLLNVIGDTFVIGKTNKFSDVYIDIGTALGGTVSSPVLTWEYSRGGDTWQTLSVTDGTVTTYPLQKDGVISFTPPSDWATDSQNGSDQLYFVRLRVVSGTFSTEPTMYLTAPNNGQSIMEVYANGNDTLPALMVGRKGGIGIGYNDTSSYKLRVAGSGYFSSTVTMAGLTASTGAFSGAITNTLSTTGLTYVGGLILNGPAATAIIPVQNSPIIRFSSQAWNGALTKINSMDIAVVPTNDAVTSGRMVFKNTTVNGVADADELMTITSGGLVGIGVTNPAWKLETNGDVNINGITLGRGPSSYASNLVAGNSALNVNTTGQNNTALGYHSLIANTTGSANVALGSLALQSNNTGISNIGIGYYALQANTYGGSNIAIGQQSLNDNVHGDGNTAVGYFSLFHNTTADLNTGLGQQALTNITSGGFNSALGFSAGSVIADGTTANQTSDHSVYLGYFTRPLANGDTNEIVIGSDVTGAGSNSAVLGNDNISKTLLKGSVGIGLTNPSAVLTLKAGTTGAGTAPLKFTTGTNMTNPESGAMEWDGSRLYMTNPSLTRQTIAYLTDIAGSFSLGALGTSPNANGMTLNNQVLNLEPASASYGGAVSTTTQTFAGAKTFSQLITGSTGLTITGGAVNLNSGSNYAINIGTGTNNQPIAIGGGSNTLAINTSGWAVSTAGALTGISGISNDGGYTQSGTSANTFTGTPTFSNATYSAFFTGGNVGIGTTTVSSAKLVIANAGTYAIDAGGFKVTNLAPAVDPPDATRLSDVMGLIHDATSTLGSQYWGQSGSNLFASSTSWNIGIGTTDPGAYKLKVAGDVAITGSLQTETGADFAEEFLTNEDLPSGTVVVMGDQGYKSVKPCTKSYDSQVVGVVSNNPSIIAGRVEGKNKAIIAMMGVVKVKVLAINGAINRGDLLVSSGIRGYAMKSQNFKVGTIIGKALEALEAPSGEINVLVNLQ